MPRTFSARMQHAFTIYLQSHTPNKRQFHSTPVEVDPAGALIRFDTGNYSDTLLPGNIQINSHGS